MTTPSRANGLRIDAVRKVERIVSAAEEVFARAGSNASMDDIAAAAGLGIATVYRRFPSKEQLLNAVLDRRFDDVVVSALRRSGDIADPREAMRVALEGAVLFVVEVPNTIDAAPRSGLMTMDLANRFFAPLRDILAARSES
jgi:AcrR family transcriptional regulator